MLAIAPAQGLTPLYALLLGALQGVAEFLPISSSGHLSLAQAWLHIDPEAGGHRFNIAVHAGTLLAVLWVYRADLWTLARDARGGERAASARGLIVSLLIGTLPLAVVLVPAAEAIVIRFEQDTRLVGVSLLITAGLLGFTHRSDPPADDREGPVAPWQGGLIGVAQLLAVLPGISRSGATIAAALSLGLDRARAARFSFLLSIPAIAGASAKELAGILNAPTLPPIDPLAFTVGFVTSFIVGLLALRALLALLERFGLLPFVPYLVALGTVAILVPG